MATPTIYDVARKAGVGIGTVSRVINGSGNVQPSTAERVLAAMRELNFRPNAVARQLPRGQWPRYVGVITLPFTNYYSFAERLRGVQTTLSTLAPAYEIILYSAGSLEHVHAHLVSITQSSTVDALMMVDLEISDSQHRMLQQANIPVVSLINQALTGIVCIGTDDIIGGKLATEHLIALGHRRIAYVGEELDSRFHFRTSEHRYQGYVSALADAALPLDDDLVKLGAFGYDASYILTKALLELPEPPTAIFAMSDQQALGSIAAVRHSGLRVPEDVSVIGYDDLEISEHVGLTTVRQHLQLSGEHGIEYLLNAIQDANAAPTPPLPSLEVVQRGTTAAWISSKAS